MKKLLLLFIVFLTCISADSEFDYYADGIYDTFIEIDKEIKEGLNERYMSEYEGQFIVAINVDNASTVKIIFYKAVGAKKGLSPTLVKHVASQKSYLVYGHFDRKANARELKKRMIEHKISDVKIFNKAKATSYRRNPIVIKNFVSALKYEIRKEPSGYSKTKQKQNKGISSKIKVMTVEKEEKCYTESTIVISFLRLREKYCKEGFIKDGSVYFCDKRYHVGQKIKGFLLKEIKEQNGEKIAVLLGDDGQHYKLKDSWCKNPKSPCGKSKYTHTKKGNRGKSTKVVAPDKKEKITNPNTNKQKKKSETKTKKKGILYYCDFTNIPTVRDIKTKKPMRVKDTPYAGFKEIRVKIYSSDANQLKIRGEGKDYILISRKYFERACKE